MAKLQDIADALGVNVSTVSRALAGSRSISRDTAELVRKKAEELSYSPSRKTGKHDPAWSTVGIIVPELISEYYARLVHMAKRAFKAEGYCSVVTVSDFNESETLECIRTMSRIGVKCLLVVMDAEETMSESILRAFKKSELPILLITPKYYPLLEFDCIHVDEYSGIIMGIQHLKERGYSRIGCIGDKLAANHVSVFRQVMKILDVDYDPKLVFSGTERAERGGYVRMKELLSLPDRPDAVFCCYDQMAIGAIHAITESGLRIPEDIAVLGFDDLAVSKYIAQGLTTIANPYEEMISIAVSVLTKRIQNPDSAPQQIALRPKLMIRATT